MSNANDQIQLGQISDKTIRTIRKTLEKVYFFTIATTTNDEPQATMIQPILTEDWKLVFMSKSSTKKVRNLQENPNTWLIADATGRFNIPKVVYIKGTAELQPLTTELFEEFLTYHGPITRRIFRSLVKDGVEHSTLVTVTPEKFITVGLFGKMNEQISFDINDILQKKEMKSEIIA